MKVGMIQCVIISAVLAILGYLIFASANINSNLPLTVSLSLLVSGIITPILASLISSRERTTNQQSDVSSADVSTLYVGNLPYRANEDAVKAFFSDFIAVQSVRLMKDRKTGKRKGYGFIEVVTDDVDSAIDQLNDTTFQERTLKVRPAKDKNDNN
ncbi:RNA recognition motif domain-containing protein [Alteromonas halophila]|uniref:RNA-binding protein n=1 Tax=Alteromonas halophila TaxID=516698 RepID=A0A918JNL2_9ALTE|nr:RNA-binding protein [Alteromonas halophila]GGW91651.1 RNA-binding protein [Alteromonas halophila]